MADDDNRRGNGDGRFDPRDPERTAAHRLGPPMRPMRPGARRGIGADDTGFVDRVVDDGAPVDVAAVRHDDELIEALAAGGAVNTADQAEFTLASLLADWRDEIVTTPITAGPSLDDLIAATEAGRGGRGFGPPRAGRPMPPPAPAAGGAPSGDVADAATPIGDAPSRRRRRFTLVAGAAAAAVALLGGGTVLVNSASPGDGALWSVKEVVFSDAASQTVATSEAKAQLESATKAIGSNDQAQAQAALASARQQAAKVKNGKDRAALEDRIRAAEALAGLPVGSTDLPTSTPPTSTVPSPSVPTTPSGPTVTIPTTPTVPTTRPTTPRPTTPTTTVPTATTTVPTTTTTATTTTTVPTTTTEPTATTTRTRTTTTTVTTTDAAR